MTNAGIPTGKPSGPRHCRYGLPGHFACLPRPFLRILLQRPPLPSWPGPRCARPRAHAPGTQRPLPRSFARCRYLDRCRLLLSASAVLGAAKRLGAGLSLRPYFVARRQLLQRGPQRVELAAVEAWRCAPAPLTAPCACAMTPATLCTDPAPPDALTCRLTPSRPTAA